MNISEGIQFIQMAAETNVFFTGRDTDATKIRQTGVPGSMRLKLMRNPYIYVFQIRMVEKYMLKIHL